MGHGDPGMAGASVQARIDAIQWYHEFDFGNGLRTRAHTPDTTMHRQIWAFIERQLASIDFRGKTVLEVGSWDGYWSFWAERHGARSVLATDDLSQNWSRGDGIFLAKELFQSAVEIRQDVSVYNVASLGRRFDIVMCLGVYYHLHDPFLALAQIRHCCHANTTVLLEGNLAGGSVYPGEVCYAFNDTGSLFLPSASAFDGFLQATYLQPRSQARLSSIVPALGGRKSRAAWIVLDRFHRQVLSRFRRRQPRIDRAFTVCVPFEGVNNLHYYTPPFGLAQYDDRFRSKEAPV
jgi:tRNA (mo5U34)-methyltransferase